MSNVGAGAATWDPTVQAFDNRVAYSNGNRKVTVTTGFGAGWFAASSTSKASGKLYFETTVAAHSAGVGIGTGSGLDPGKQAQWVGGYAFHNGTATGLADLTPGDTIQVAVDLGAKRIWFRANGTGNWNNSASANPATGSGGLSFADITGAVRALSGTYGDLGDTTTCNLNASEFAYPVPSGFSPWGAAAAAAAKTFLVGAKPLAQRYVGANKAARYVGKSSEWASG